MPAAVFSPRSAVTGRALLFGLLLMTSAGTPAGADDNAADGRLITDFTRTSADLGWYVVNDNVMGGRSEGGFELKAGELRFSGRTNTRGGGFSSIRTGALQLDLSQYAAIRLRVFGDGRRYTWRLTTDARYFGRPVAYWAEFETTAGAWRSVDVPFAQFVPRFRGARLDGPPLDTSAITGMGLMIYDKRDGPFELQLASVRAVPARPFSLDRYQWQKRLLVVSAPRQDDPQLQDQLEAVAATREAFAERDMLLVVLLDDGAAAAGGEALSDDEVAATRETLGIPPESFALRLIGKDGTVKLSGADAAPMTEIYALIDSMPMRQREMQDR